MDRKPPVWQMIKEACDAIGDQVMTYPEIKKHIWRRYGDVNEGTINAQIIICTVNQPSRVHYPENKKPRLATSQYDFLFSVGRGQVVRYDSAKHGVWEIRSGPNGTLAVGQTGVAETPTEPEGDEAPEAPESLSFAYESHLRDFIAKNLFSVAVPGSRLTLYQDQNGRDGVEYPTGVGPIDILARDDSGGLVVFELKVSRGHDHTVGQILRYMGWVKQHLAGPAAVRGVIVAKEISEPLRYAVSMTPLVCLYRYEVSFSLSPVEVKDAV